MKQTKIIKKKKSQTRKLVKPANEVVCPQDGKYHYTGRMLELLQAYNAVMRLLYPNYAWYIYPGYLIYSLYYCYKKYLKDKYRLIPISNDLFDKLMSNELLKSEHVVFATTEVYEEFSESAEVNFVNLIIKAHPSSKIQNKSNEVELNENKMHSIFVQILPLKSCQQQCLFVKENFYSNIMERYAKFMPNEVRYPNIWVGLEGLDVEQTVPEVADSAHITFLKQPYELPTEVLDTIVKNYFTTPRILHQDYTYRIELCLESLLPAKYYEHFDVLIRLPVLYFRCKKLEIGNKNSMQKVGVVLTEWTNIIEAPYTTIQYLPSQYLDSLALTTKYPFGLQNIYNTLRSSIDAFLPKNSICLSAEHIHPVFLLHGARGSGKTKLTKAIANDLGLHYYEADCAEIVVQVAAQTELKLKTVFAQCRKSPPVLICFQNFEIFGLDPEGNEDLRMLNTFELQIKELYERNTKYPTVVVALSSDTDLKPLVQRLFLEIIHLSEPTEQERFANLRWLHIKEIFEQRITQQQRKYEPLDDLPLYSLRQQDQLLTKLCPDWLSNKSVLELVAKNTQGFLLGDLQLLHQKSICDYLEEEMDNCKFTYGHFVKHIEVMHKAFASSLGAPKVPKVLWSDIGGLAKLKDEIQNSLALPLKYPHLMVGHLRRSGILLYGPPGTGKTLIAKAVATECKLNFLSVQGPELLNMYVGQSELNVREVFAKARSAAPCVLFLDELDSLAPRRGVAGDSGGVMDRVVSQLLAEMDCLGNNTKPVFILAATNRPDLIDTALLRPGRFDKLYFVGPCSTVEEKLAVLETQTKQFHLGDKCNLRKVAELLTNDMTGADLYSIASNAWRSAARRTIRQHQQGLLEEADLVAENVLVEMDDFLKSFEEFIPSISIEDLEYFKQLKSSYSC